VLTFWNFKFANPRFIYYKTTCICLTVKLISRLLKPANTTVYITFMCFILTTWRRSIWIETCCHNKVLYINLLLTPCSTVLPEKLTGFQLVKKFPAFYGTRRFITAVTSARHLSLSSARSIQPIPPHPTSWRSTLILSSHLRLGLPSGLFP